VPLSPLAPTRWELGGHLVEPKAVLSDYHHLRGRALDGDVLTELPPFLAAVPIREKRLVPLLPQYPLPEWSINLIYPPHRHPSNIVRTYLDFCQSYLPKIAQVCEIGVVRSRPNRATVGVRDRVRPSEFPPWDRASPFQGKDRKVRFPRVLPIPVGAGEGRLTEGAPAVRPWWLRLIFLPLSG